MGSTAVPGLKAKPVIDIIVGLRFPLLTGDQFNALRRLGYGYVRARAGRLCLYRGRPRSYFLHLVEFGGPLWEQQLLFRDYLRLHPEAVRRYTALKGTLAVGEGGAAAYTVGKRRLIAELLGRARRWKRCRK